MGAYGGVIYQMAVLDKIIYIYMNVSYLFFICRGEKRGNLASLFPFKICKGHKKGLLGAVVYHLAVIEIKN